VKQSEQPEAALHVQVVEQSERSQPSLPEQVAKQPEQNKSSIHAHVVEQSEGSQPSLPEQVAKQPEQNRQGMRAQVVKRPVQERPALHEQVAFQPPALPVASSRSKESKEALVSDSKPGSDEYEHASDILAEAGKTGLQSRPVSWPEPMTHVSVTERPAREEEASQSEKSEKTFTAAPPRTDPPARELHIKIWDQHATESSASSDAPKNTPAPGAQISLDGLPSTPPLQVSQEPETRDIEEDSIEDRPTLLLESHSAEALASDQDVAEETKKGQAEEDDISERPVIAQPILARFSALPDVIRRFTSPIPAVAQPIPARFLALPDAIRKLTSPIPAVPYTRQRLPVIFVAAVIVALILIGVGSWVFIAQPFSVPAVTQPQLSFSDAHMGLSLLYPNGWTYKKDATDSIVQFYDSSHTAQIIIAISNTNTSTITTYLQKQLAQLGMSGAKSAAPLSFAGMSWQSMQGTVQQSGANYTCTIFATTHANHLVMLTQLAPQSIYNEEESVVFSALRQSLRLL
jgi:hypothetical protein